MSEIKLAKCPFCGSEVKMYNVGRKTVSRFQIICRCGQAMTLPYQTEEKASKAWNTRKPMERILKRLRQKEVLDTVAHIEGSEEEILTNGYVKGIKKAIEICEEEGGIE